MSQITQEINTLRLKQAQDDARELLKLTPELLAAEPRIAEEWARRTATTASNLADRCVILREDAAL